MKHISEVDLQPSTLMRGFSDNTAGAVVLFSGETRVNGSNEKIVDYLFYEAHALLAENYIAEILKDANSKWNLAYAHAVHRVGKVRVGECAVLVITATKHRKEAYAANQYIIDRIKHEAPIWKNEFYVDGSNVWGGNCNCFETTRDVNKHIYDQ